MDYSKIATELKQFRYNHRLVTWYGKLLAYNGNEAQARIVLKRAAEMDINDEIAKKALKNIRNSGDMKEEASSLFK